MISWVAWEKRLEPEKGSWFRFWFFRQRFVDKRWWLIAFACLLCKCFATQTRQASAKSSQQIKIWERQTKAKVKAKKLHFKALKVRISLHASPPFLSDNECKHLRSYLQIMEANLCRKLSFFVFPASFPSFFVFVNNYLLKHLG
jgi:hypothetical protein